MASEQPKKFWLKGDKRMPTRSAPISSATAATTSNANLCVRAISSKGYAVGHACRTVLSACMMEWHVLSNAMRCCDCISAPMHKDRLTLHPTTPAHLQRFSMQPPYWSVRLLVDDLVNWSIR